MKEHSSLFSTKKKSFMKLEPDFFCLMMIEAEPKFSAMSDISIKSLMRLEAGQIQVGL
jgi:hypothetical protein